MDLYRDEIISMLLQVDKDMELLMHWNYIMKTIRRDSNERIDIQRLLAFTASGIIRF